VPTISFTMRNYFSTHMLWGAEHYVARAKAIEDAHTGESRFDIEHRAYVVSAIVSSALFLEAMVNELFQDAYDEHGTSADGYIAPLSERTRELMREWWASTDQGFENVLEKYQLLLVFGERTKLDRGAMPYQDAKLLIRLRNLLVHYRSETVGADLQHR